MRSLYYPDIRWRSLGGIVILSGHNMTVSEGFFALSGHNMAGSRGIGVLPGHKTTNDGFWWGSRRLGPQ